LPAPIRESYAVLQPEQLDAAQEEQPDDMDCVDPSLERETPLKFYLIGLAIGALNSVLRCRSENELFEFRIAFLAFVFEYRHCPSHSFPESNGSTCLC
jgi:hypothetical protein